MAAVGWHRTARFGALCAILVLAALPGCASIRVDHIHRPALLAAWRASAVLRDKVSPRTMQMLRQCDLAELYERSPDETAHKLHDIVLSNSQPELRPDLLFALAEINYVLGRKTEKRDCGRATTYYYQCAGYAYHYLFDEPPRPAPDMETNNTSVGYSSGPRPVHHVPRSSIFDPRFRLACDLYNAGLAKLIAAAQRDRQLDPRQELRLPTLDGKGFTLSVVHYGFEWKPEEFGKLQIADDYQVVGVANHHRTYGLGVPLIATRAATLDKAVAARTFYPRQASFAATAFFRFAGSLSDLNTQNCGRLELYNPLTIQAVETAGQLVPLETDLTTPLAYFLAHSDLGEMTDIIGFVHGNRILSQTGIRMLAPYQPGKIPVILVHGLLSSPLTWAPVMNDLQADPVLRQRYQIWYYYYPTGEPYLRSAAELRRELALLRREVDPQHRDSALDNMVFVGHSMGGLIARLMTMDSGDDFWKLVSPKEPFDKLDLPAQVGADLRRTFFFERESCVTRCVFIATPHRGSKLAPSPLGRLAVHLVHMPNRLMTDHNDLIKDNPDLKKVLRDKALPTSVDLLKPGAPALKLMSAQARPKSVHFHSIVGVISTATTNAERWLVGDSHDRGDGVVPYKSAHLDRVDELIVPADHFHVHHHPLSIQKIRSILMEHYQDYIRQQDAQREFQLTSKAKKPMGAKP